MFTGRAAMVTPPAQERIRPATAAPNRENSHIQVISSSTVGVMAVRQAVRSR